MCGIAGLLRPEGAQRADLRRMIAAIAHRGPDGQGERVDGEAAFGHARLAIIDPVSSGQPMVSEAGDAWLTFNGEIYNSAELAANLEPEPPLATRGDTEVLLRLLMRDGIGALGVLRGMFAFGFYDR